MKLSNDSEKGLENSKNFQKVYLDNGATTKVDEEAAKAVNEYFTEQYGNASSLHEFGREAKEALENAREIIAKKINAEPSEIIFTSGGTESDNLALKGIAHSNKDKGNCIITTKIEHPAILETCKELEKEGFKVTYLDVDNEGLLDLGQLKEAINEKTILASVMHANNEIGAIQPVEEIGKICRENGIYFHTDAVQSFTKIPIDVKKQNIDLASFSGHKVHGPKGVGVLFIRKHVKVKKEITGGHHESDLRAGTENIPGAAGFAKAVEISNNGAVKRMEGLRDKLIDALLEIPDTILNGSREKRLCNNVNISFNFIEGESLLMKLDDKGIAVSTGSACSSQSLDPSHVLLAIGLKHEIAHGSIRFTLSKFTTEEEIDYVIETVKGAVKELREVSPLVKN